MRLGNIDVPCGCDSRKYIMFQAGQFGFRQAALLAAAGVLVLWAARKVGP